MKDMTIVLFGFAIKIRYNVHMDTDITHIEWYLEPTPQTDNTELCEYLLRLHYSHFIEGVIKEQLFYQEKYLELSEAGSLAQQDISF